MQALHLRTPLVESAALSQALGGRRAWLKLESLQPPRSFEIRGIGRACQVGATATAAQLLAWSASISR